jgi:hypothetical protein
VPLDKACDATANDLLPDISIHMESEALYKQLYKNN